MIEQNKIENIEFDHIEEVLEEANSKNDDKAIDITIKVKKAAPNSGFKENLIKEVLPSLYLVFDDTINNENNNRSSLTLTRYIQNQKFNILHHTLTNKYPDINLIIISRQGYEALDKRIRKRNKVIFLSDFDEEKIIALQETEHINIKSILSSFQVREFYKILSKEQKFILLEWFSEDLNLEMKEIR